MERDEGLYLLLLKDAADAVAGSGSLEVALQATVELVAKRLGFDVCSVYLVEDKGDLVLRGTYGLRKESIGKVRMPPSEGLTGLVAEKEQSFFTSRADEHPRFKFFPETGEEKFRSFGGVPLLRRGRCTGVLTVQTIREYAFNANEIVALQTLAGQIVSVIDVTRRLNRAAPREGGERRAAPGARALLVGLGTSPGIGLGRVVAFGVDPTHGPPPARPFAGEAEEVARFEAARAAAVKAVDALAAQFERQGAAAGKIFRSHQEFLLDPGFIEQVAGRIRAEHETAEHAVHGTIEGYARLLTARAPSPELREKVHDFYDVRAQLLRELGVESSRVTGALGEGTDGVVILAEFLTPAETAHLDPARVVAIVTEHGSETSHASILARSLGIPAVVAIPDLRASVAPGERLLVDGDNGFVFHEPEPATEAEYQKRVESARAAERAVERELRERSAAGPRVKDVALLANVGLPAELTAARERGANGIGLLRTEFFFLQQTSWPSRKDQVAFYKRAFRSAPAGPIVVRLLDAGGDKELPYVEPRPEPNPILGLRSVRFLLAESNHCRAQIGAILEAAAAEKADVRILVPLVTTAWELTAIREMVSEVSGKEGLPPRPLGMMVEAPSVLYQLEDMLPLADFVSIGTNDLTQYLLAVDRDNELVRQYYSPYHPAVVRALASLARALARHGQSGSICGEMAGNPLGALALLALGYRSLSVRPRAIPALRCLVHCVGDDVLSELEPQLVAAPTSAEVERLLRRTLRGHAPFLLDVS